MIRAFVPTFSQAQSQQNCRNCWPPARARFADTEGAVRYVVADHGEKGLTFAIEPISWRYLKRWKVTINDKSKAFPVTSLYTVSQTMLPSGAAIF